MLLTAIMLACSHCYHLIAFINEIEKTIEVMHNNTVHNSLAISAEIQDNATRIRFVTSRHLLLVIATLGQGWVQLQIFQFD